MLSGFLNGTFGANENNICDVAAAAAAEADTNKCVKHALNENIS